MPRLAAVVLLVGALLASVPASADPPVSRAEEGGLIVGHFFASTGDPSDTAVEVVQRSPQGSWERVDIIYGFEAADNNWDFGPLPAGAYRLHVYGVNDQGGYWWPNVADRSLADDIEVADGETVTVSGTSQFGGVIRGKVIWPKGDENTQSPYVVAYRHTVGGGWVREVPYEDYWGEVSQEWADGHGHYYLHALRPGQYRVRFVCSGPDGLTGYANEWWKEAHRSRDARTITVSAAQTVWHIRAHLDYASKPKPDC